MDRLFARILLLLVTGGLFSVTFQEPTIRVDQNKFEVCEGETVNIICIVQQLENYKVSWYYSSTPTSDCGSLTDRINENLDKENVYTWPVLKINSTKTNDSGWYYCKITQDIPVLIENCSDGAEVIVNAKSNGTPGTSDEKLNQTQNPTTVDSPTACASAPANSTTSVDFHEWWVWFALAVGIAVLVVSIVAICILTHDNKEIIYENTKQPSETSRWTKKTKTDICNTPPSKKFDTIKPLRKYDTYSNNRTQRL